jgi:hypothetical protein
VGSDGGTGRPEGGGERGDRSGPDRREYEHLGAPEPYALPPTDPRSLPGLRAKQNELGAKLTEYLGRSLRFLTPTERARTYLRRADLQEELAALAEARGGPVEDRVEETADRPRLLRHQALKVAEDAGNPELTAAAHRALSLHYAREGAWERARTHAGQADDSYLLAIEQVAERVSHPVGRPVERQRLEVEARDLSLRLLELSLDQGRLDQARRALKSRWLKGKRLPGRRTNCGSTVPGWSSSCETGGSNQAGGSSGCNGSARTFRDGALPVRRPPRRCWWVSRRSRFTRRQLRTSRRPMPPFGGMRRCPG